MKSNTRYNGKRVKERIAIKPYVRTNPLAVIPNSLDEDLNLGPDNFLSIQDDRKWVSTPMRGGKVGSVLGIAGAPMSPMIDEEETGDVIKRTVVGGKKEFMESIKVSMAQNQKNDYMTTIGGAMMSSNTLTH